MSSHFLVLLFVLLAPLSSASCGDGIINAPTEQCDGSALDGKSCESFCMHSGTLSCSASCAFDTSACTPNVCGDNSAAQAEQCDGTDLKGQTCQSLGFDDGTLHCGPCTFNTTECIHWYCGDGLVTVGETCDGSNLSGKTCVTEGFDYGTLSCNSCGLDTSGCHHYFCGDGMITGTESCEGSNLAGVTCLDLGFDYGTLTCTSSCNFAIANCHNYICGDAIISGTETCEGSNLAGATCSSLGYASGALSCTSACGYNTSACIVPEKDCIGTRTTLEAIITCWEAAVVPNLGMTPLILPTTAQAAGIEYLINTTLHNDGNCKDIVVPTALIGDIMVRPFVDQTNGVEFCIVMDHKDANANGKYDNGFILFITPNHRADIHRRIHIQAPHVQAETLCSAQAVKVLRETGAQSVLIPGAHRGANQSGSTCHSSQFATEAVEDNRLAFHTAFKRIFATSNAAGWDSYYVQFHGSANSACNQGYSTQANIFISMGTGNSSWYTNSSAAVQIRNSVKTWTTNVPQAETPGSHSCNLVASTNIQGRIVNNVPVGSECAQIAGLISGKFITIEQHANWRAHTGWFDTIRSVFATDCASGRHYDSSSMMCVDN